MMSIGTVRGLVGSVTVTDSKGMTRELRVGDAVEINDTVQAAAGSTVHIAFTNGNFATIGSHEKLVLDPSVIDPMAESDDKAATGPSVADIQAMIAEGADPTEIAEATAAGADAGTRGDPEHSGSHSFVVVGQDAARGEVTPGFETGTFSNPVPESEIYDGGLDTFLLEPDPEPDDVPEPPVVSDHLVVNEHGLDNAFDASESALIKAPDGYAIVGVEDGKHGTVSQDGKGNWHYTLSGAIDSGDNPGVNTVTGADTVKMVVQDAYGNQFTVDVKVDIIDDVPVLDLAGQGYQNIHVGSGASVSEAAGSINYDFGADDGKGKSFTVSISDRTVDISDIVSDGSYTIQGEYGKLTISADGSYNYQANPNIHGGAQDSFTLTITDADGDTKNVKLDVTVDPPSGPDADSIAHVVVDEAGLNDAGNTSEISKPITMPDGYTIVMSENGYAGSHGIVTFGKDGQWHYTLNEAIDSGDNPGVNTVTGADTVKMVVQDAHGNQFTVDVKVDIIDDVPVLDLAGSDYRQISVGSGGSVSEIAGSIHYDFGADDGLNKSMEVSINGRTTDITEIASHGSCDIQGEFGKLTINADGSYSYQANPNIHGDAQDSFVITITDADGDTKDVKLDIDVTPSGVTAGNASAIVSEHDITGNDHANAGSDASHGQDNLPGNPAADESRFSGHLDLDYGVNGAAHNGAFAWNVPSGNSVYAMVDGSWQSVTWKVNGTTLTGTAGGQTVFTLTIDPATGDYQASLNAALKHNAPGGSDMSDSNIDFAGQTDASSGLHFGYTITDASGNTAKGSLDVDVQDDVPVFSQSSDSVTVTDHHLYTDNSELKFTSDNIREGEHSISFGKDLTVSTATVHYGKDGNISDIDASDGVLHYKNPAGTKFDGLGVQHSDVDSALMKNGKYTEGDRFGEINYSQGNNSSEAIVIDLNGKIAYGMNIGLSNFFGNAAQADEKALFTFYLNGEIVDVKELTSVQSSGLVNGTFNSVTAGFDKVVISAIDNGVTKGPLKDNSDFSITSIQFVTASGQPLSTAEGHIEATSADGIKSYDFGEMAFLTADGEKIILSHSAASNGDIITGTLADGTVVLEGFLSDNGTWSLHQYVQGIHNAGSNGMSLDFVATDNDGDRTTHHVIIPAAPDIAHVEVNEHGLNDGPDGSDHSETVDIKAPDGFKIVDIADGEHGKATQDSDDNWHYTLNEAINSGNIQGTNTVEGADTIKVTIQDADGNQFTVDVKVDIIDDIPVVNTTHGVGMQDMVNATDGVDHFKAGFDFDFGADKGEGKSVEVSIDGQVVTPHHTEGSIGGNHQTLSSLEINEKTGEVRYEQNSEVVNTAFGTQGQAHDITVSVTDSDGDVVSQTVHLETVGMQVGGVHSDTITGGSGADIIIGDKGHIDGVQNTVTYNLSLVLDVSNSMYAMLDNGNTRLASSVEALSNLIDSIAAQTAQGGMTVNIQLVGFHSSAFQHNWLSVTQDNVNELKNYVNELAGHIRDGGASNTNYQAAFGEICEWFGKLSDVSSTQGTDVVNKVYFLSDGVPNSLTVNGAIVDYASLHKQPEWPANWPHDSYAPDYFIYARDYVLSHTDGYATLLNQVPGLEMNSAGFAGSGLDAGTLNHFDNTGGGQILHNSHDLTEFLKPGVIVPPVDADRDTVFSGEGNDIVFGDHVHYVAKDGSVLDGQSALIAAVSAAGGDTGSNASIHQFLTAHPELADTLADPNPASNQNDLLVGGTGHDILVGQGGNDLLIGDGDNALTPGGSLDHLHHLLDSHAQGDDLAAGIRHLFDHGTAQEISHFTSGIENMDVESSHDGNDHLYGGTGNDVLVGMGGNDHLYGGEGHDILLGGSGNDVLVGGKGDDILSGGSGNDIFRYTAGDLDGVTNGDTITDFHLGNLNESKGPLDVNADVLDISELITGHDKPTSLESLVNGGYLNFEDVTENADGTLTVKLSIDVDGHHGDAQTTNLATITMSGFEHHAGTDIVQDLMNQLVNNENIKF